MNRLALLLSLISTPLLGQLAPCTAPGPILFVPLGSSNQVEVINMTTNAPVVSPGGSVCGNIVLTSARQGSGPVAVAPAPFSAASYAANASIAASDTDPFAVVSPLLGGQIPVGTPTNALAFNPLAPTMLYAVNTHADHCFQGMADGGTHCVTGYSLSVIDTTMVLPNAPLAQYATVGTIATGNSPNSIAISDTGVAYVTHTGTNRVFVIALPGGGLVASVDVGFRQGGVAVTPLGVAALGGVPSAYVTIPTANQVVVMARATSTVTGSIAVGRNPVAIATNPAGTLAFVANNADGTISVIATLTSTVVATIPLSSSLTSANNPTSVTFVPGAGPTGAGEIAVLNQGTKTVSIIDPATFSVVATISIPLNNLNAPIPAAPALSGSETPLASVSVGAGGGGGLGIARSGDGGAEPLMYYSRSDGSLAAFGLYTGAPKASFSVPASAFVNPGTPPPAGTEREMAYDPINKLIWYSTYDGTTFDQIRAYNPTTQAQGPVIISNLPKQVNFEWDRHVFIDYGGSRLIAPNPDGSVSLYNLTSGALSATVPAGFFRDGATPGVLRHFASDARTGKVWYANSDGSFVEITLGAAPAETGRVIPPPGSTSPQIGSAQTYRRHFVIDSRRNLLIYEVNAGASYALASIDLGTLQRGEYNMTTDVFTGASALPFLTISLKNADQCQLTLSAQSGGTLVTNPASNPGGYFDCGTNVTVNAVANPGFQLSSYSGDLTGTTNPQTLAVDRTRTVSASFAAAPAVSVSVSPLTQTLVSGQTQQFTATVSNASNTAVSWSVLSGLGSVDANGVYTASVAGQATLKATSVADPTKSGTATIQVTAGAASSISVFAGTGQSATINTNFPAAFQATVLDSASNPVPNATVTFTAPGSGAGGLFPGSSLTATATTNASGLATAPSFIANGTTGTFTVTATVSGVASPANFSLINLASTAPTITATAGAGQSAGLNTAFATALQATVRDASSNPVANATVTFTAPSSGAGGTFAGGILSTTATTNASGVATASVFTANSFAGSYTVSASASGVAIPATFTLTNGTPPPAVTIFSPAQGAGGVATNTALSWTGVSGATSYDVYFGTTLNPPFVGNTAGTTFNVAMNAGFTYYWLVTAKNAFGSTPSALWFFTTSVTATSGLRFVPVTPCRVMDTRNAPGPFGGPLLGAGTTRNVAIPQGACNIPFTAQAYSLNITVVPGGSLGYLTIWPAGQAQPVVSTLNSLDGRIVANAAIVPAGAGGAVSVYVSDATHMIIDVNGYFAPASTAGSMSFYPAAPCRVADTRGAAGAFGAPFVAGNSVRNFPIAASACGIPGTAQAYSLNMTVVPRRPLSFLTTWPSGQPQPLVSTLNSLDGSVVANAAIVPAGTNGAISVYVTDDTDLIIDINGYFAPPGAAGALSLYTLTPCRVVDTRLAPGTFGGPSLPGQGSRSFPVPLSGCNVPGTAQAYSLNATVVPPGPLTYLTAWASGQAQPLVSTLNSLAGKIVANAAIVPAGLNGAVSVFVSDASQVILDINAYFAQ